MLYRACSAVGVRQSELAVRSSVLPGGVYVAVCMTGWQAAPAGTCGASVGVSSAPAGLLPACGTVTGEGGGSSCRHSRLQVGGQGAFAATDSNNN